MPPRSSIKKRTTSLPPEHAAFIDRLVAPGSYALASEVVRAGLRALQERDAAIEKWLREEVGPTYDAIQANPGSAISAEDTAELMRHRHAARLTWKA